MIPLLVKQINKNKENVIKFVEDNLKIKEGIYLKVDIDTPFDENNFKDYLIVDDKNSFSSAMTFDNTVDKKRLSEYFNKRDYMSKILNEDANKCIDVPIKRCLSTVYLTLAISLKTSPYNGDGKFKKSSDFYNHFNKSITSAYLNIGSKINETLSLDKLKKQYNYSNIFWNNLLNQTNSEDRKKQILLIDKYINDNIDKIFTFVSKKELISSSHIKIFFYSSSGKIDDSIENYKKEEFYYLSSSLINKGQVEIIDGELKGSIPLGFNNNPSKPFLKPKHMNFNFVELYTIEEALDIKLAFDLMKVINDKRSSKMFAFDNLDSEEQFKCDLDELININNKSLMLKLHFKDKYVLEYDLRSCIPNLENTVGNKIIECINYFSNNIFEKRKQNNNELSSIFTFRELIAFIMFTWENKINSYSDYSFYGPSKDIGSMTLENKCKFLFSKYKYTINEILNKRFLSEEDINFLKRMIDEYIKSYVFSMSYSKDFRRGLIELLNIKMNLLREDCEEIMFLNIMKKKIIDFINNNIDLEIESDQEFYFLLGQMAYYLESQSRGDIDFGVFKFYTNKKDVNLLKKYLIQRFERYSYRINLNNNRFKKIFNLLINYIPNQEITKFQEQFYMGICTDNIFYMKKENTNKNLVEDIKK